MDDMDISRQLRELAQLRSDGSLTDEEYALAKRRLLPQPEDPSSSDKAAESSDVQATVPQSHGGNVQESRATTARSDIRTGLTATIFVVGGATVLLIFVIQSMTSAPLVLSSAGWWMLGMAAKEEPALGVMILLIPIGAAEIVALGVWLLTPNVALRSRRNASVMVLICAAMVVVICLVVLLMIQSAINQSGSSILGLSALDLTGGGFWVILSAMGMVGGAAIAAAAAAGEGAQRLEPASPHEPKPAHPLSIDHPMTQDTPAHFPSRTEAEAAITDQPSADRDAVKDSGRNNDVSNKTRDEPPSHA
ncbi:SHOCT domain-containing protein [Nonomuraea sp. 3N208]|uniref:SHOCT domain-containing protein n=1 Tax=Nonomuraea sp. 3N208 TaxID=3457421 RepID=UPI003FD3A51E